MKFFSILLSYIILIVSATAAAQVPGNPANQGSVGLPVPGSPSVYSPTVPGPVINSPAPLQYGVPMPGTSPGLTSPSISPTSPGTSSIYGPPGVSPSMPSSAVTGTTGYTAPQQQILQPGTVQQSPQAPLQTFPQSTSPIPNVTPGLAQPAPTLTTPSFSSPGTQLIAPGYSSPSTSPAGQPILPRSGHPTVNI